MTRENPKDSRRPAALAPQAREGAGRFLLSAAAFALTRPGFAGRLDESALAQLAALAGAARGFERAESPALREAAFAVTDLHETSAFEESAEGRSGSERTAGGRAGVLVASRVIRLDQALAVACRELAEGGTG